MFQAHLINKSIASIYRTLTRELGARWRSVWKQANPAGFQPVCCSVAPNNTASGVAFARPVDAVARLLISRRHDPGQYPMRNGESRSPPGHHSMRSTAWKWCSTAPMIPGPPEQQVQVRGESSPTSTKLKRCGKLALLVVV